MNKIWVTSDFHFKHKWMLNRRIELGLLPKGTTHEDFENIIVERWNSVVGENDLVIFLGDLTFEHKSAASGDYRFRRMEVEDYTNVSNLMSRLKGSKIWIFGNHDRRFMTASKADLRGYLGLPLISPDDHKRQHRVESLTEGYFESLANWDNIEENPFQVNNVIFTHEPMIGVPDGLINYHGHLHDGLTHNVLKTSDRHINVNVEFTDFTPVDTGLRI